MKKKILSLALVMGAMVGAGMLMSAEAGASCAGMETNIINCDGVSEEEGGSIFYVLRTVLQILTTGVGVLGILGVVIAGIMYLTARDSETQVAAAKGRLMNVAVGMILFAAMGMVAGWLMPGGIPEKATKEASTTESEEGRENEYGTGTPIGDRENGSEDVVGPFGNTGRGNEGWAEQN